MKGGGGGWTIFESKKNVFNALAPTPHTKKLFQINRLRGRQMKYQYFDMHTPFDFSANKNSRNEGLPS